MDYYNGRHCIIYIIITGFVFYLLSAVMSALFIYVLPLAEDFYTDYWENIYEDPEGGISYEFYITEFKNDFEKRKFYHNKAMEKRNTYLIWLNFVIAVVITSVVFYFIPERRKVSNENSYTGVFISILAMAFCVTFIMPLMFSFILPSPIEWFPKILKDFYENKVNDLLIELGRKGL